MPPIVAGRDRWQQKIESSPIDDPETLFQQVVLDEAKMLSHCRMLYLTNNERSISPETQAALESVKAEGDLSSIPAAVRFKILTNPDALMALGEALKI